ncbi:putative phage protein [Candidatus Sodalis pierantonius str. SOPE]|uniref:Putative phage protein n=1 Tax=Candidatus Sodalis pierantonii str. SOPE TaxID=2342 RepID=W0HL26_9GAMM|nr:DUF2590 family protein [Candidatus Sodalis pierantonius]AHF72890.1 putative phage protein [Candidatus Sodalis pierantonius str. SOPE]
MSRYRDLLITDGDFTLNSGHEPKRCTDRVSITQDCAHALLESGLLTRLVAERSRTLRADLLMQVTLLLEEDERLIPGTVLVSEETPKRLWVTAQPYDFDRIEMSPRYDEQTRD